VRRFAAILVKRIIFAAAVYILSICSGCSSALSHRPVHDLSDSEVELALEKARKVGDRTRALELARVVLWDALQGTYRYGYYSRKTTPSVVIDLKLLELAELMRQVAAMDYEPPPPRLPGSDSPKPREQSYRDLLNILAIIGALDSLTLLDDPDAQRLNHLQLSSRPQASLMQSRAISNLKYLKAWNATEDVRRVLYEAAPGQDSILTEITAIQFLADSSLATEGDCTLVPRLRERYGQCFDPTLLTPGISGCGELRSSLSLLIHRLHCSEPQDE
jgi:hypothetical protein